METVIDQIRQEYTKLSRGQKAIADFILNHYEMAAYMTAARVGERTGVSESTVVRFAMELGFSGYPAFQQHLRDDLKANLTAPERMKTSAFVLKPEDDIWRSVLTADIERLKRAQEQHNPAQFNQAVELISNAKRIFLLGIRSTAPLAIYLNFYLKQIFKNVVLIDTASGIEVLEQIIPIEAGDVLIAMSFPRYATTIHKALAFAKQAGATTVVMTDKRQTPFANYCDCMLIAPTDMVAMVDALAVPFSMVTALIVALAVKHQAELLQHLEKLEAIWEANKVYEKTIDEPLNGNKHSLVFG